MVEKDAVWHRKNKIEMFCFLFSQPPHSPEHRHKHKHTDIHGHRSLDSEFLLYTWQEVRNRKYTANMEWPEVGRWGHLWGFLETSFPACESSVRRELLRRGRRWQADQDRLHQGINSVNRESKTRHKKWRVMEVSTKTSLYRIWQCEALPPIPPPITVPSLFLNFEENAFSI